MFVRRRPAAAALLLVVVGFGAGRLASSRAREVAVTCLLNALVAACSAMIAESMVSREETVASVLNMQVVVAW